MKNKLLLIRGVPGSGKTTLAHKIMYESAESDIVFHYEADQYFERPDGEYAWYAQELGRAHSWCYNKTRESLESQFDSLVIVSNTFTRLSEMQKYIDLAKELEVDLEIITATGNYDSVHNVPQEVVQRMIERFEPTPSKI